MKQLLKDAFVYRNGCFTKCDIAISDNLIQDIGISISSQGFDAVYDLNHCYLIPGFVDVHVHLREPGFSYKETIETGTLAAAHGGYTAVCAMPNLDPVPDSAEHLAVQLEKIRETACVKVYPYGSITLGQKGAGELVGFSEVAGDVVAFTDDGRGVQSEELMREAMREISTLGKVVAAHCEVNSLLRGGYIHDGAYARLHGHRGICSESEYLQIARDLKLAAETGCRYHVCHISTKESVALIRVAKAEGVRVTCETAPHYLTLCDGDLQEDGRFKMNPPIRSEEDRRALIEGVQDGTIDVIATDHAPHSAEEKGRGLEKSAMGVVGLETAFPVLYTNLVKNNVISFEKLVEMMSVRPREIFGLGGGKIEIGESADLAALDIQREYRINPDTFLSKGRATPFAAWKVTGENRMTMVEGEIVWQKNLQRR